MWLKSPDFSGLEAAPEAQKPRSNGLKSGGISYVIVLSQL